MRRASSQQIRARRLLPGLCAPILGGLDRRARRRSRLGARPSSCPTSSPRSSSRCRSARSASRSRFPAAVSIVALADKRQILVADPRDAVLSLMQMSVDHAGRHDPGAGRGARPAARRRRPRRWAAAAAPRRRRRRSAPSSSPTIRCGCAICRRRCSRCCSASASARRRRRSARPSGSASSSCAAATIRPRRARPTPTQIAHADGGGAGQPPRAALSARPSARRGDRLSLSRRTARWPSRWAIRRGSGLRSSRKAGSGAARTRVPPFFAVGSVSAVRAVWDGPIAIDRRSARGRRRFRRRRCRSCASRPTPRSCRAGPISKAPATRSTRSNSPSA